MVELKGKALAELRNKEIKEMLVELENQRDLLYDEVANRKGQIVVLEDVIKNIYDRIVSVNKEAQQQELREGVEARARKAEATKEKQKKEEADAFAAAARGIKTPKPKRRKRSKGTK